MADDYEYDGDDPFGFEDEWLYVEDEFALADELAETQIADPGYAGTNHEIEMESYQYDLFAYWDDLEYADDAYWDDEGSPASQQSTEKTGQKRKRGTPARTGTAGKRRKVSGTQAAAAGSGLEASQAENVVFMSRDERNQLAWRPPPALKNKPAVAFLPDWRTRYADQDGEVHIDRMPADMQQAAQAKDQDTPEKAQRNADAMLMGEEGEGDWEDEEDAEEAGGEDVLAALDPDMLKAILKQKLGEAGLEGMDEGAFMATLSKMLAGDEDKAAGDLANSLLGQATAEGGNTALSGWLSQQGVSMDAAEEDDASSVATVELPQGSGSSGQSTQISPPDSAVSVPGTKQMALHSGSPTGTQKDTTATTRQPKRKLEKRVTFDVPPSSAEATQDSTKEDTEKEASGLTTSEDNLESEPTVARTATRAKKSKSAPSAAQAKKNVTNTDGRLKPDNQLQAELDESLKDDNTATKATAAASVRQTRKRKAPAEDADLDGEPSDGKQRAVKEPATRKTRSARAKVTGR